MERMNGPLGWCTPTVLAISEKEPSFARAVLAFGRDKLHLLGCVLAAGLPLHETDYARFADDLQFASRERVLRRYAPSLSKPMAKLIGKLRGKLWTPPSYLRLVRLEAEGVAGKWLRHAKHISRRDLILAERLPKPYRQGCVLSALKRHEDVNHFLYALTIAAKVRPDLTERGVVQLFQSSDKSFDVDRWRRQLVESAQLPEPPWSGDAALKPVRTYGDLSMLAKELKNCLRGYHRDILTNQCVVYSYAPRGKLVGAVEIERAPVVGWELNEAKAAENEELSYAAKHDIAKRMSEAGIVVPPWFFV